MQIKWRASLYYFEVVRHVNANTNTPGYILFSLQQIISQSITSDSPAKIVRSTEYEVLRPSAQLYNVYKAKHTKLEMAADRQIG
jgi:hypothetical protein